MQYLSGDNSRFKYDKMTIVYILLNLVSLGLVIYYNFAYLSTYINSDFVSEMNCAQLMWEQKTLFPDRWYFSSEIRLLSPALLAALFYGITGKFTFSYLLSIAILDAICVYLYFKLMKKLNVGIDASLLGSLFFIVGLGKWYLYFTLVMGYYLVYLIICLLVLIYFVDDCPHSKSRRLLLFMLMAIIAFVCGAVSTRMTIILFLPLVLSAIFYYTLKGYKLHFLYTASGLFIANVIGLIINRMIISNNHYITSDALSMILFDVNKFFDNILAVFPALMRLLGYEGNVSLFSIVGLSSFSKFIFLLVIFWTLYKIFKVINDRKKTFILLAVVLGAFFSMLISAAVVDDIIFHNRYLFLFGLLCSMLISLAIDLLFSWKKNLGKMISGVLILFIGINFFALVHILKNDDSENYHRMIALQGITKWLEKNEFDFIYAGFWNAGAIRGLSDGKIENVNVHVSDHGEVAPHLWLQDENVLLHESLNRRVAFVLTIDEEKALLGNQSSILYRFNGKKVYHTDSFVVYSFARTPITVFSVPRRGESYVIKPVGYHMSLINQPVVDYLDESVVSNGMEGYFVAGPYETIKEGLYTIQFNVEVIDGNLINCGFCDIVQDSGNVVLAKKMIDQESQTIVFEKVKFDSEKNFELRVFAQQNNKIKVKSIDLIRVD